MPPTQIFVSTRSRREYPRRRPSAQSVPASLLLVIVLLLWALAVLLLWQGAL